MAPPDSDPITLKTQCAVYGIGMFSTTMFFMGAVVLPLWVISLNPSPLMVGVVLGARQFLPLFFSIHAGALIDRIGPRKVMLFFAVLGVIIPLLYPVMPWLAAALVLQLFAGLSDSVGWLGAQTMVGKLLKGRTRYAGRLSVIIRFGHLSGPPLIGAVWDFGGPWAAFILMSLWGMGTVVCALMLPAHIVDSGKTAQGEDETPARSGGAWKELLPRPSDYLAAMRLLAVPVIATGAVVGMVVHLGNSLQATFYVVYLNEIGISGTATGILFSAFAVCAGGGSMMAAWLTRFVPPLWLLIMTVLFTSGMIAVTPLLGTFVALFIVISLRGITNGIHQPLIITTILRGTDVANQGKAMGLRSTCNRIAAVISPLLMGAIGEIFGIEFGFYVIGALVMVILAGLSLYIIRRPETWGERRGQGAGRTGPPPGAT
jgi:MFS family permease